MNNFLPIQDKKIGILGAGLSGLASAKLANHLGAKVFISDANKKRYATEAIGSTVPSWNFIANQLDPQINIVAKYKNKL